MKKVLVISYYWPPSGGVSVLRSLKIVKYLRSFGWEPIVYAPSNAHYPYLDNGGFEDIPDNITILKRRIIEPFTLFKLLTGRKSTEPLNSIVQVRSKKTSLLDKLGIWIRGNFFIPDARSLWIGPSTRYLARYLAKHQVDAIFSDGPPHTNTMIAYRLASKLNIPWLADFQDPWTQADYYQMMMIGSRANRRHSSMEQQVFKTAQKITIASPSWKEDLENIGAKNVDVIYYGYDESDFEGIEKRKNPEYFDIVHIGLLGIDRDPRVILEALRGIKSKRMIRIVLAGQVDFLVLEFLKSNCEEVEIVNLGTISRKEALSLAMNADLLLLPLNKANNAKGRLPAKLYEYLRTHEPILALGPVDSDASKIISECNAGKCFEYDDMKAIREFLDNLINHSKSLTPDEEKISFYSNENQTRLISTYLDEITT